MPQRRDAIYCRYSSHSQDDGTSIEVQLEHCRKLAGPNPLEFIDRAVTGRTMHRPQFSRMLEAAERGDFDRLIVYRYDRIGRSAHTHAVASDLEDQGIEVISCAEGKDQLARGIHFVVGEDFSRKLSKRVSDSLHKRFDQRSWTGGPPPYGYKIEHRDNRQFLAIDPSEAETVRSIFKIYLNTTSGFKHIARELASRGVKTRHGKVWAFTTVRQILVSRYLIGEVRFGKRKMKLNNATGKRVPVNQDAKTHRQYVDNALRIISDEDFARAQAKIASRAKPRGATKARRKIHPFTGLIYCSECNSVYYCQKSTNGGKHFYVCSQRYAKGRASCPNSVTHREDRLLEQTLGMMRAVFDDADALVAEIVVEARKLYDQQGEDEDRLRREFAELDRKSVGLQPYLLDASFPPGAKAEIARQLDMIAGERRSRQSALEAMGGRAVRTGERLLEWVRKVVSEAREALGRAGEPEELHAFIERYVGPSVSLPDGRLVGTEAGTNSSIAATGLEPVTRGL